MEQVFIPICQDIFVEREFGTVISQKEKEEAIEKMKELIDSSPDDAINYLRENPVATLVLPKIKLQMDELDQEKCKIFLKLLDEERENLFLPISSMERNGLAFTLELLIDNWREVFGENDILAMKKIFNDSILMIEDKIDKTDLSSGNKVIIEMLNDFKYRIKSLENYERKQFRQQFSKYEEKIREYVRELVNTTIGLKEIPGELDLLLQISTMSIYTMIEFRAHLSKILASELRSAFGFEEEEMKYNLAPWIGILEHTAAATEDSLQTKVSETKLEENEDKPQSTDENYM